MSLWWIKFRQKLYPPELRIFAADDGFGVTAVSLLLALAQAKVAPPVSVVPPESSQAKLPAHGAPGKLEKEFVIDLCNQIHRLSRSTKKLQGAGAAEAEKLEGNLNRLQKMLEGHAIQWEDLSGQAFDPGRTDFEPLGEPQISPGLSRMTIIQCERPVIRLSGMLIQSARGIVGRPA
jgi:hypothetical protein